MCSCVLLYEAVIIKIPLLCWVCVCMCVCVPVCTRHRFVHTHSHHILLRLLRPPCRAAACSNHVYIGAAATCGHIIIISAQTRWQAYTHAQGECEARRRCPAEWMPCWDVVNNSADPAGERNNSGSTRTRNNGGSIWACTAG